MDPLQDVSIGGSGQVVGQGDQKMFRILVPARTLNISQTICVLSVGMEAKQISFNVDGI